MPPPLPSSIHLGAPEWQKLALGSAVVAISSKFIERSKFTDRHDAICDKENRSIKLAERFDSISREDVDCFEFEEYIHESIWYTPRTRIDLGITKLRSQYVEQNLNQNLTAKATPDRFRIFTTTKALKRNTKRRSGFPFHQQYNHGRHVPAIFDYQDVRINNSWAAPSWLSSHHSRAYMFHEEHNRGWTCSCYFWLSTGAYSHFMSCTIMANMLPSLSTLRQVRNSISIKADFVPTIFNY